MPRSGAHGVHGRNLSHDERAIYIVWTNIYISFRAVNSRLSIFYIYSTHPHIHHTPTPTGNDNVAITPK